MTKRLTDNAALKGVERILGVRSEDVGGGNEAFIFPKPGGTDEQYLIFGWASGALGYQLMDDGRDIENGEAPRESDAGAQAAFIRATCARLGYPLAAVDHDADDHDATTCATCAATDPHMTEHGAAGVTKEAPLTGWRVGDAGFTVFGPRVEGAPAPRVILTGKDRAAVRLAGAAPDLLAASERALGNALEQIEVIDATYPDADLSPEWIEGMRGAWVATRDEARAAIRRATGGA